MTEDFEKGKAGSSFRDFLKEQWTDEDTTEQAMQRVQAFRLSKGGGSIE